MQQVEIPLGENHGVALKHSATLSPEDVVKTAAPYGRMTSHATYVLNDSSLMTFLFFSEAEENTACHAAFADALGRKAEGIVQVGWMNENAEAAFAKKSYVVSKWGKQEVPATVSETSAFLLVYLKRLTEAQRASLASSVRGLAQEAFEDEKEGGRLFLRFASDDDRDLCRKTISEEVGNLGRDLSYADAADFALARKSSS